MLSLVTSGWLYNAAMFSLRLLDPLIGPYESFSVRAHTACDVAGGSSESSSSSSSEMLDVQVVARSYLQLSSSCSIHYQVNRWLEFEQQVNFRQVRATHDGDFKGWNFGP